MKKITLLLCGLLFICVSSLVNAQSCAFDQKRFELQQDPAYIALEREAEEKIQNSILNGNFTERNGNVITIPIVVHVLHLGEAVGSGSNISDAQIQSSIDNLNDFYRGQTTNSPIDFEIEFALAQRDPDCNATTGINRIDASGLSGYSQHGVNVLNSNGASYSDISNLISWPQTDYFNVWIVTELDGNNGGFGFQGYAYFYNENFGTHGSVMMSTVFGYDPGNTNGWGLNSNGDNSTVVHEVGHFFHLYHTFQGDDTNNDGVSDACPADATVGTDSDGCSDTVPHQRETSTCPANNTCTGSAWVDDNTIYNVMSYYNCTDRLTNDQKTRARAAMEGTALSLSKGSEAPVVGFTAPIAATCNVNSPAVNNFSGITRITLNGTTLSSSTTEGDSGNLDKSQNCTGLFSIDTGTTNTMNVTVTAGNFHQLGVWIDWNNDGDFEDTDEQQHLSNDIVGSGTVNFDLTYPTSIPYDSYIRMRLVTDVDDRFGGVDLIDSACYSSLVYGQSEDYALYVESATLNVVDETFGHLQIYTTSGPKQLHLEGQLLTASQLNLYDINGRKISNFGLDQTSIHNVLDLSSLSIGVYIIEITDNTLSRKEKLIVR
ncbi:GEVED domain-containing protein [Winogradskyella poriferorum]|uniref:GEVED domain-containing protein n=1 Tax=Winogradskyella poriferorum TaxID=307627 RepID=UPI003D6548BF